MEIVNPNVTAIVVESLRATLVLNGTLMGTLTQRVDGVVPATGGGAVTLRFTHTDGNELARLRERMPPRGFVYRLTGEASIDAFGPAPVPFRLEGTRRLP
jgi:hypothetical protein